MPRMAVMANNASVQALGMLQAIRRTENPHGENVSAIVNGITAMRESACACCRAPERRRQELKKGESRDLQDRER